MTDTDPTVRPRAIHLLEYLRAVRDLREQPVRDVADYGDERWMFRTIHPAAPLPPGTGPGCGSPRPTFPRRPPRRRRSCLTCGSPLTPWHAPAFGPGFRDRFPDESEDADELEATLRFYADGLEVPRPSGRGPLPRNGSPAVTSDSPLTPRIPGHLPDS